MKNIWEKAVEKLKSKISDQNINTWIKPIQTKEISDNHIILEVPNKFIKDWVKENYNQIICETLYEISKINFNIEIQINRNLKNKEIKTQKEPIEETIKPTENKTKNEFFETSNINPNYTFKSFVSGPSNQFAHAAALAVSNNPATTYNPLFIYGGVGLGKTHIIHAIGNEVLKKNSNIKVCYYSSEKFTNELINSLRHAKMDEFRNKFRSIDILLIDDIQFIAGKKSTQEEFFHTFNALYESHKQIVVTSDKFPKEIPDLEERLRSRFEWGLIADIQSPDTETKQAILKMKADQNKIDLPEDVAYFLANSITSNVRELEGMVFDAVSRHKSGILSMDSFKEKIGIKSGTQIPQQRNESKSDEEKGLIFKQTLPTLREAEQLLIDEALNRSNGNQTIAARLLGLTRRALNNRLSRNKK